MMGPKLGLRLGRIYSARRWHTYSPAALFANGEKGVWYDPSDLTTLFQDSAGTIPAVVDQPIGLVKDKSGNNIHLVQGTTAQKPILRLENGLYYLDFDGVAQGMVSGSLDLSGSDGVTVFAAVHKRSDLARGTIVDFGPDPQNTNGSFALAASIAGINNYRLFARGSTLVTSNVYNTAPATDVLSARFDISDGFTELRRAPFEMDTDAAAALGTGVMGNKPLHVGRRNSSSFPFNGRIYGLIVVAGRNDDVAVVENYLNAKAGAY